MSEDISKQDLSEKKIDELIAWLKETASGIEYGEVGIVLIKHGGKFTRYNKIFKEHEVIDKK